MILENLISISGASREANKTRKTIYRWINEEKIHTYKTIDTTLVDLVELQNFIGGVK